MIEMQVDPLRLVRVRHTLDGKEYRITRSAWRGEGEFLNTYTRGGNLKVQRGCTRPVRREYVSLLEGEVG